MKKLSIIVLTNIFLFFNINAQCYDIQMNDIQTPACNPVETWLTCESSLQTRQGYDYYFKQNYPNATQIKTYDNCSSTRKFNCHGYAWLRVEQSIDRWIGYSRTTDEDIFMSDGSYVQVSQETYPGKVSWGSGDHSAVTTYQQGVFISKWNEWPLMKHAWNYSPFGASNLKYYVKNSITGPNLICSQETYTVNNLSSNATVSWSSSPSNMLTHSSSGTSISASKVGNGMVTLTATINQCFSISKAIWLGSPSIPTIIGPQHVEVGGMGSYTASVLGDFSTTYQWSVSPSTHTIYSSGANATIYFNAQSDYTITVSATNACGTTTTYYYVATGELEPFSIYPNPATDLLTVSYNSETENKGVVENNENKFTIQLWNETNGLVKSIESNSSTKQISLRGLSKGMYSVHIVKENKTVRKQLIWIK